MCLARGIKGPFHSQPVGECAGRAQLQQRPSNAGGMSIGSARPLIRGYSFVFRGCPCIRRTLSVPAGRRKDRDVDSDLAESVSALKESFARRGLRARFGRAEEALVARLQTKLKVPRRFREFLAEADPLDVETRTPSERLRLIPSFELEREQVGFALDEQGRIREDPTAQGWRPCWVIIGHSALLGDPYFLDLSSPDAEGDCPVCTAMSGIENWKPRLCASSLALFLRILALSMEVAAGFPEDDLDVDDEQVFRDTLGSRIRQYDPAALKAGHWT
jgi:hypothetical protein